MFRSGLRMSGALSPFAERRELKHCIATGRFVILKDVSCDLTTVKRRIAMAKGTPLSILNANASIAWDVIRPARRASTASSPISTGSLQMADHLRRATSGIGRRTGDLPGDHGSIGIARLPGAGQDLPSAYRHLSSIRCRVIDYDIRERFWWGLDAILDRIVIGTDSFRAKIAALPKTA